MVLPGITILLVVLLVIGIIYIAYKYGDDPD